MIFEALKPTIYGGYGNLEIGTECFYGTRTLKVGGDGIQLEAQAVWAVGGDDVWEEGMRCVTNRTVVAFYEKKLFTFSGYKPAYVMAVIFQFFGMAERTLCFFTAEGCISVLEKLPICAGLKFFLAKFRKISYDDSAFWARLRLRASSFLGRCMRKRSRGCFSSLFYF